MSNLKYEELNLQPYFKNRNLSRRKQILLFKFRCRMINVGGNFGRKNSCPICLSEEDKQEHLFVCEKLDNLEENLYLNLFSNDIEKMEKAIDTGDKNIRKREKIANEQI